MKVAVFGANGYMGQHIVHYLVEEKECVPICFDIQDGFKGKQQVKYLQMDISDKVQVESLAKDFDYIYFFSGLTGTDVSIDRYEDYLKVNEIGFLHLLDFVKGLEKKPKLIFPSTRLVYKGVEDISLPEEAEKEFKTIYASSKYNGELYLQMFRNLYGLDYSIFRICVPYGNIVGGQLSYGTISFFLGKAMKKEPIVLFGDGNLKRTFTHVMDVCRQIIEVSEMPESNGHCYNIDGETFSLKGIATIIGEKYDVPVQYSQWPEKALKLESGDTIFKASKIKQLLPNTLNFSLQEWINV
jgi:UDP-glucose 4-epimerase